MLFAHIKKLVHSTITSANGLVSFKSNVEMPLKVTCEFSPVQEGTGDPSPDNVRPISGWDGCEISKARKNLLKPVSDSEFWQNGYIKNNGVVTADNSYRVTDFISIRPGIDYTFFVWQIDEITSFDGWKGIAFYDGNKTFIPGSFWQGTISQLRHVVSPDNAMYVRVYTVPETCPQLGIETTVTAYEPYQGETIPINWKLPDEYQEVEYLESTGVQWINTLHPISEISSLSTNWSLTFAITSFDKVQIIAGVNEDNKQIPVMTNGVIRGDFTGNLNQGIGGLVVDTIYTLEQKDGYFVLGDSKRPIISESQLSVNFGLFGKIKSNGTTETSTLALMRGYRFFAETSGVPLIGLIPCYRKADRKPGMYDLVTGTFNVNQGTGDDFTVGPDVSTLPGTVYGGTVMLNEDGSADLVVTQAKWVEDGHREPNIAVWSRGSDSQDYNRTLFGRLPSGMEQETKNGSAFDLFICNNRRMAGVSANLDYPSFGAYTVPGYSFSYTIPKGIETKAEIAAYFADNPSEICYNLLTPKTYHFGNIGQLQSFLGTNNIWHNMNGDITVEYYNYQ